MVRLAYIVCSSPRSGSSLLCDALAGTGVAGKPGEYSNPSWSEEIRNTRKLGARSEAEYIPRLLDVSTTPNGVFGTKLHGFFTEFFMYKISAHRGIRFTSLHEALNAQFPALRYIFVSRNDTVAQAVSYYRALMTGEWWRWDEAAAPPSDAHVPFDQFGIKKCLQLIKATDTFWDGYFKTHSIKPLRVTYEQLTESYEQTVREALRFLGLPDDRVPPPKTVKIADARSREWAAAYAKLEKAAPFEMMTPPPRWAPY